MNMLELLQAIPFSFGALFPVINPIGSSVIFLTLVNGSSHQELNKLSFKIALYATILLTVVLLAGSWILRLFGITIPIVLIGGGLVLAYIGWQLLNKPEETTSSKNDVASANIDRDADEMAFYPLTMPVTAGPGCIAVAIAIGAHSIQRSLEATLMSQIGNVIGICLVGITIFFCYRYAFAITSKLGTAGTRVIMRLAAFINLCIGLEIMWHGIKYLIPR
jgi:multiple antibiotic resistance protein